MKGNDKKLLILITVIFIIITSTFIMSYNNQNNSTSSNCFDSTYSMKTKILRKAIEDYRLEIYKSRLNYGNIENLKNSESNLDKSYKYLKEGKYIESIIEIKKARIYYHMAELKNKYSKMEMMKNDYLALIESIYEKQNAQREIIQNYLDNYDIISISANEWMIINVYFLGLLDDYLSEAKNSLINEDEDVIFGNIANAKALGETAYLAFMLAQESNIEEFSTTETEFYINYIEASEAFIEKNSNITPLIKIKFQEESQTKIQEIRHEGLKRMIDILSISQQLAIKRAEELKELKDADNDSLKNNFIKSVTISKEKIAKGKREYIDMVFPSLFLKDAEDYGERNNYPLGISNAEISLDYSDILLNTMEKIKEKRKFKQTHEFNPRIEIKFESFYDYKFQFILRLEFKEKDDNFEYIVHTDPSISRDISVTIDGKEFYDFELKEGIRDEKYGIENDEILIRYPMEIGKHEIKANFSSPSNIKNIIYFRGIEMENCLGEFMYPFDGKIPIFYTDAVSLNNVTIHVISEKIKEYQFEPSISGISNENFITNRNILIPFNDSNEVTCKLIGARNIKIVFLHGSSGTKILFFFLIFFPFDIIHSFY